MIKRNLLHISSFERLLGNPALGASWEGFVIENIIQKLSSKWRYSYYRSASHQEIDLVLENSTNEIWAVEIKRSVAPSIKRSFHDASSDIGATKKFVVYNGAEQFPLSSDTEAIGLVGFLKLLK